MGNGWTLMASKSDGYFPILEQDIPDGADDDSTTKAPEQAKSWSLTRDAFLVPTSASPVRHITPVAPKIPPKKTFQCYKGCLSTTYIGQPNTKTIWNELSSSNLSRSANRSGLGGQQIPLLRVEPWLTGRCLSYRLGKMSPYSKWSTPQPMANITYSEER